MKIAIFGGSFNPPHLGHEKIIQELSSRFDQVYVVPVDNYMKNSSFMSIKDRVEVLQSITHKLFNVSILDNYIADPEFTYTYRVIEHIREIHPLAKLTVAMGTDYTSIDSWKNSEYIKKECDLVFISRNTPTGENWGIPSFASSEIVKNKDFKKLSPEVYFFLKRKKII